MQQVSLKKWTVTHEAAKVGCVDILMLLLRHGGMVMGRDYHGVTHLWASQQSTAIQKYWQSLSSMVRCVCKSNNSILPECKR